MVKSANVESTEVQEAIGQLGAQALDAGMNDPIDVDVNAAKTVAVVSIPVDGNGTDSASNAALATLRERHHPVAVRRRWRAPRSP